MDAVFFCETNKQINTLHVCKTSKGKKLFFFSGGGVGGMFQWLFSFQAGWQTVLSGEVISSLNVKRKRSKVREMEKKQKTGEWRRENSESEEKRIVRVKKKKREGKWQNRIVEKRRKFKGK